MRHILASKVGLDQNPSQHFRIFQAAGDDSFSAAMHIGGPPDPEIHHGIQIDRLVCRAGAGAVFPNKVSTDMPAFYPWSDEPEFE